MPNSPKSLLELAGAPLTASALKSSAVILIDFQLEYTEGNLKLPAAAAAVQAASELLAAARLADTPVFHVVHHGRPGGQLFNPNNTMVEIVDDLKPVGNETIITKTLPNAFAMTSLASQIEATGRKELILAGFMTHMCLSSTARAAIDLGFRCTIVAEACATRDLPSLKGGVVDADTLNTVSLAALADRFAIIVPSAAALGA
jgi:nicotinamidase-related amidase